MLKSIDVRKGSAPHSPRARDDAAGAPAAPAEVAATATVSTREALQAALARALEARRRILASATNARLIDVLAAAAALWSDRTLPQRVHVTGTLASALGMHPDMLGCGLDFLFASIRREALCDLLAEAENPAALEPAERRAGSKTARLIGPRIVFHSLAGNVPGLAVPAIVAGVLGRSVTLVRDSSRQPDLTVAFLDTLASLDRDVAAMIVPMAWAAGDAAWERQILLVAERAELYGSDRTLRTIRERNRDTHAQVIERGTRMSIGFVPACTDLEGSAEGFALDAVLYDGLGCLTPHALLVVGRDRAHAVAEALAAALETLETRWPRTARTFEEEAARRAFVDACEAESVGDTRSRLWRGKHESWVVHLTHAAERLELGPALRCLRVIALVSDEDAFARLAAVRVPLAGAGLALSTEHPARGTYVSRLRRCGATLVTQPGRMHAPPLSWTQDGRRRLGDLLGWRTEGE